MRETHSRKSIPLSSKPKKRQLHEVGEELVAEFSNPGVVPFVLTVLIDERTGIGNIAMSHPDHATVKTIRAAADLMKRRISKLESNLSAERVVSNNMLPGLGKSGGWKPKKE